MVSISSSDNAKGESRDKKRHKKEKTKKSKEAKKEKKRRKKEKKREKKRAKKERKENPRKRKLSHGGDDDGPQAAKKGKVVNQFDIRHHKYELLKKLPTGWPPIHANHVVVDAGGCLLFLLLLVGNGLNEEVVQTATKRYYQ